MALITTNQVQARTWAGYSKNTAIYGNFGVASQSLFNAGGAASLLRRAAFVQGPPASLEPGVNGGYLLTKIQIASAQSFPFMLCEVFDMGTMDTAVGGVFTDGVASPSRKQHGVTGPLPLQPIVEVSSTLASTATRTLAINYTDMAGNAKTSTAIAMTASSSKWSCGFPILASGDIHIQDVTGAVCTVGSSPSGTVRILGLNPLYEGLLAPQTASLNVNLLNEGIVARVPAGAQLGIFAHTNGVIAMQGTCTWVGDS